VADISCIRPIAPFGEIARGLNADSTCTPPARVRANAVQVRVLAIRSSNCRERSVVT
jgi:hypothetical protein